MGDGNVCVQFYLGAAEADDGEATARAARAIATDVASLGGALDAQTPGLIAFTIPVAVGFPAIEAIFAGAVERHPGAAWQYANVYDEATGDPLGWWEA